ncbi:MAG: nitronate monooxygenase [Alphaproteobacteria bacterium]|nr:nitronate monooxygenase [Alphaproteobacteria bacterium]
MWRDTELTRRLGITLPIVQAPMAGSTTPEMVAAVSEAGGLGSLGAAMMTPDAIRKAIRRVKSLTARPFNVNLFALTPPHVDAEAVRRGAELMAIYRRELGLPEQPPLPNRLMEQFHEQAEAVLQEGVAVFSFTFGLPSADWIGRFRKAGAAIVGTATHPAEAAALAEAGCDMVSAQGFEAGAHRGSFLKSFDEGQIGLMALLPQVRRACRLPVLAAGGIMTGEGIAAALALGAAGAQLGTAFLTTHESAAHPAHKAALPHAAEMGTEVTRVFSGRPARSLRNRMLRELQPHADRVPPYPAPLALNAQIYQKARAEGLADFMSLWSGQGGALCRTMGAGELMARLAEETDQAVASLAGRA